jgi:hypothetical protein
MNYSWMEIEQLERILAAEAAGQPIDRAQARRLAEQLAHMCPDIRQTMQRVQQRMAS